MNSYRLLGMDSGAKNCTTTIRHDILTVIFLELIYALNRRSKIDKVNMPLSNLISTGSSTKVLNLKFLPDLKLCLNMHH